MTLQTGEHEMPLLLADSVVMRQPPGSRNQEAVEPVVVIHKALSLWALSVLLGMAARGQ